MTTTYLLLTLAVFLGVWESPWERPREQAWESAFEQAFGVADSTDFTATGTAFWEWDTPLGNDKIGSMTLDENCLLAEAVPCGDGLVTIGAASSAFTDAGWPVGTQMATFPVGNHHLRPDPASESRTVECRALAYTLPVVVSSAGTSAKMWDHFNAAQGWQLQANGVADTITMIVGGPSTVSSTTTAIASFESTYHSLGVRFGTFACSADAEKGCCTDSDCTTVAPNGHGLSGTCLTGSGGLASDYTCGDIEIFVDGDLNCDGGCTSNTFPDIVNTGLITLFGGSDATTSWAGDVGPTLFTCVQPEATGMCAWARRGPEGTNADSTGFTCALP